MELLQLRYFHALAATESMSATAKALFISVPSLSLTISRLEKEMGVPLFDRVGNRIRLNDSGRLFNEYVGRVLSDLDYAVAAVSDRGAGRSRTLSIASTSPNVWLNLFGEFSARYPEIGISHEVLQLNSIDPQDLNRRFDFLITSPSDVSSEDLESEILYGDDYPVLLCHPQHPFAKRASISLREAKDEPFIALTKGFSSRKYFDDLCQLAGFAPQIVIECDYTMRTDMVQRNLGVAVATARTRIRDHYTGICTISITDPIYPRRQALFWHRKRYQGENSLLFRQFAREFFAQGEPVSR